MVAGNPATVAGSVARPLGRLATVLGRYDDAEAHFRLALELHTRLQAPYWTARTELDWANLLLARARPGDKQAAGIGSRRPGLIAEANHYGGLLNGPNALLDR